MLDNFGQSVEDNQCFTGWDAYKGVIASNADYVILADPPVFRPRSLTEAIDNNKNVFMEKPAAVDAPGIRQIIAAGEAAKDKGLSIAAGTQRRHQGNYIETIKRLHDGAIGDIRALHVYWCGGPIGFRPRREGMSEVEFQIRNWYHYLWLSGDHIVEQHVHNLDVGCWVKGEYPVKASALGGRAWQARGDIWDHHAVDYEFADGTHMQSLCEQIPGAFSRVNEVAIGTKGRSNCQNWIGGETQWTFEGDFLNPYIQEHKTLIEHIRSGVPINEASNIARSTLVGIMGRMAGYDHREVTWEEALNSDESVTPDNFESGPHLTREVQIPGGEPYDPTAGWMPDPDD